MKIGIFDSGLGGLSVLHCAKKMAPDMQYVYYADEDNVPYGEKTKEQVKEYTIQAIDYLLEKGVEAIIIACNTATSSLPMEIRRSYPIPIVGMEPALKEAIRLYGKLGKRIMIAATEVTIRGDKLHHLVDSVDIMHQADMIALPGLVRFAEAGSYDGEEIIDYLRDAFSEYDMKEYSTVVLGCTHFNFFKAAFRKAFGEELHFVDGNHGTVRQVLRLLGAKPLEEERECIDTEFDIYFSGREVSNEEKKHIHTCFEQLNKMYKVE